MCDSLLRGQSCHWDGGDTAVSDPCVGGGSHRCRMMSSSSPSSRCPLGWKSNAAGTEGAFLAVAPPPPAFHPHSVLSIPPSPSPARPYLAFPPPPPARGPGSHHQWAAGGPGGAVRRPAASPAPPCCPAHRCRVGAVGQLQCMQVEALIQRRLLCQQFPQLQPHRPAPLPQRCVFGDLQGGGHEGHVARPHRFPSNVRPGGGRGGPEQPTLPGVSPHAACPWRGQSVGGERVRWGSRGGGHRVTQVR